MHFTKLEALASRAIERQFGERVRVEPRADGKFVREHTDVERPPFEIARAIVDTEPGLALQRSGTALGNVSADECHVSVAGRDVLSPLARGDRVRLLDRPGCPVWTLVREPEPDGCGRIILRCAPVSARGDAW